MAGGPRVALVAVSAAVLAGAAPGDVVAVAITAESDGPVSPCGACRQVLAEFAAPDAPVILHNVRDGSTAEFTVAELLPQAFVKDRLP